MQFLWPSLLWLLLIIPALAVAYIWSQRRRKRFVLRYSSLMVVHQAVTSGNNLRRHVPPALFLAAIAAMIVAVARPTATVAIPDRQATVVLAIDVSGSMRTPDIKPNRIEAAKAAARDFVQAQRGNTQIGIVAFSGTASIVQVPTTDHEAVLAAIDRLRLERSTAIGSGVLASLNALFGNIYTDTFGGDIAPATPGKEPTPVPKGTHAPDIIILLTDGANVQGPSPVEAAQKAADLGVRVFTIGVGVPPNTTGGGAPPTPVPNNRSPSGGFGGGPGFGGGGFGRGFRFEVDEGTLKQIAQITDAEYFRATDESALSEIYKGLNTEVIISTERIEVSALVAGVAAVLSIASIAFSMLWVNRLF